jgi:hypothetical protein
MRAFLLVLLLMVAVVSCSSTANVKEDLDATTKAYGIIMRWKNFESAEAFAVSSIRDEFKKRVEEAANVVVVDYRVIRGDYNEEMNNALVNVEITYYTLTSNRIRMLIDKQVWTHEKGKVWKLMTLLPEFK